MATIGSLALAASWARSSVKRFHSLARVTRRLLSIERGMEVLLRGDRHVVGGQGLVRLVQAVLVHLTEVERRPRTSFAVGEPRKLELDELHELWPLGAFGELAFQAMQRGRMERIGFDRLLEILEGVIVAPNALLAELGHLVEERRGGRTLRGHVELTLVRFEQVLPASRLVVEASEARESGHVHLVDVDDLLVANQGAVGILQMVLEHLAGTVIERDGFFLVDHLLRFELECGDQLLPAAGAFRSSLESMNRAEMIGLYVEDASIRPHRVARRIQRVLVQASDLEEVGDLGFGVLGLIDGAFVQLDDLAVLARLLEDPCQRLERRRVAGQEPERPRMMLGCMLRASELFLVDGRDPRMR